MVGPLVARAPPMSAGSDPRVIATLQWCVRGAAGASVVIGALALVGWALDVPLLKSGGPSLATMKPNTALAFIVCGVALWLRRDPRAPRVPRQVATAMAAAALALGVATLAEDLGGWNFGIDEVLFADSGSTAPFRPGRMAPATAVEFILISAALLLMDREGRRGRWPAQWLALVATTGALLPLAGYLYGVASLYEIRAYGSVAIHTALTFAALALAVLAARPDQGLVAVLTSETLSGAFARRVLPVVILLPLGLGWLRLLGQRAGFYGTEFGVALLALSSSIAFATLTWWTAGALLQHERARARAQKALAEHEEQSRLTQEASRLKSEFLANMSHELRTPLNAVIGFAELMHDGKVGPVSREHQEYLGDILTSSRHLLQLINDVLDLAKVESGKMEFHPEPVNLARLAGEVRDVLRGVAARKRIEVEAVIDPAPGPVVLDPAKLKQVLYNYLSNALKFTPEGGRVTIRVAPEGATAVRLEVEDTGIGIRAEDLGRLFVEFQQLDPGRATRHEGTGLGLALTKRIVEAQGGRVGVRSTPGQGSVFFAVLPRAAGSVVAHPGGPATPARAAPPGTSTILVIEDEASERAWLVRVLTEAGYVVEAVASGAEAVARARSRAFDAITLDLLLPDLTAYDLMAAIRAEGPNRDTPVVVVTVVVEREAAAGFLVQDFLTKPVRPEDLLASLMRAGLALDPGRMILVVDDDPAMLRVAEAALTGLGYRVVGAASGAAGLQAVEAERPAAVVLDLMMPEMDGFEFLARYRAMPEGRRVPVIVWTAKDLTAEDRRRLDGAVARVVAKRDGGAGRLLEALETVLRPV